MRHYGAPSEPGERRKALRLAGVILVVASIASAAGLVVPESGEPAWQVSVSMSSTVLATGLFFLIVPEPRFPAWAFHVLGAFVFAIIVAGQVLDGGTHAPSTFFLFFALVYIAYFFDPPAAAPYILTCVLVHALPLVYDADAIEQGLLAELPVVAPAYLVIGFVILSGKRQLVRLREDATALSLIDELTGLANRRAFTERMNARVGGERGTDATGLILIDVDDFKEANTRYGHQGGDAVLVAVSRALLASVREEDMVARIGGDEFALIVQSGDETVVAAVAGRAIEGVSAAGAGLDPPGCEISASGGWAIYPGDAAAPRDLIAAADAGLRSAKAAGKGRAFPAGSRAAA
jgi:diguanylate cyclase (GGDEF)-like protein